MDRRTRVLFAALFAAIVILTAVAAVLLSETGVVDPDRPAGTTDVTGVVVGVDSSGLADVVCRFPSPSYWIRLPAPSARKLYLTVVSLAVLTKPSLPPKPKRFSIKVWLPCGGA